MPPAPEQASPSTPILATVPQDVFSVGGVMAHTFSAWRRHVLVFSLLTVVADLPVLLVAVLARAPVPGITAPSTSPFDRAALAAAGPMPSGLWLAYVATMLLFLVEVGAITHGVIHHLAGKPVSLAAMVTTGLRRFFPLLAVGLLCYVMITLGVVLLVVPGVFLACALVAALPAVVVERPGVFGAIRRSFALTRGKRFAVFVALLVVFVVTFALTAFGGFVLPQLTAPLSPMLGVWLGLAVNLVFGTVFWIVPGVVYHDLRVAKDGIATAKLAAVFE